MLAHTVSILERLSLILVVYALGGSSADGLPIDIQRLSDRVIVLNMPIFNYANIVAVSGKRGLAVIDTGMSPLVMSKYKAEIERHFHRTDWAYVINTHAHQHHVGGNAVVKSVPVIAHKNIVGEMNHYWVDFMANPEKRSEVAENYRKKAEELQARLQTENPDSQAIQAQIELWRALADEMASGFEVVIPTLLFSDELILDMGDLTLRVLFFGKGHSLSDVIVHIPEEKVVVTGGVCYRFIPKIKDQVRLDDLKRSMSILDSLLADDTEIRQVVPSHTNLLGRQDLERLRDYYRDLLAGVAAAREQGVSLEDAQARLSLERRFPYMSGMEAPGRDRNELHKNNVNAVWKLLSQE
jgi:glyoxylase-like metal-dependent hydrolase (beta-lactamase superfamily II)